MKVIHLGRGGHIEHENSKYEIESVNDGHFCIHFPSGQRHKNLQKHLNELREFAESKEPKWYVENRSRKYT